VGSPVPSPHGFRDGTGCAAIVRTAPRPLGRFFDLTQSAGKIPGSIGLAWRLAFLDKIVDPDDVGHEGGCSIAASCYFSV
jgi:hypothetical protein